MVEPVADKRIARMFKGNGIGGDAVPEIDGILCVPDFSDDRAYGSSSGFGY